MKTNKRLFLILIFLISLLCISSASGAECTAIVDVDDTVISDVGYSATGDTEDAAVLEDVQSSATVDVSNDMISEDGLEEDYYLEMDDGDGNKLISSDSKRNSLYSNMDESKKVLSKSNEATVTVTPSAETYKYGADVRLAVGLTGMDGIALDGIVILTVDNKQYVANVTGGSTNVIISNLENNTYTVFAEFLGNDLYESSISDDAIFVVNKSKKVTADVSAEDIAYGNTVTITVSNLSDVDCNLLSNYGGYQLVGPKTPYGSFFVRKGKGSFSVSDLPVGNYSAYVVFGNNVGGSYEFESYVANFTVDKANPTLNANANDISFGEDANLAITVDGVKNERLNETLLITLNGEAYGLVDSVNGLAELQIPDLSVGNYTVGICFGGLNSTNYNGAECVCSFNVNKASTNMAVTGSTVEWGETALVNIRVTDEKDNPISGNVIVGADLGDERLIYDVVELDGLGEGQARFRLDLVGAGLGDFDLTATFLGNDSYNSIKNTGSKIILTPPHELYMDVLIGDVTAGEDIILYVNASDGMGTHISMEKVNVTINNIINLYDVEEDGRVNIGELDTGVNEIEVSFDDGFHNPVSVGKTISISKSVLGTLVTITVNNISYGEEVLVEFTLTDDEGNPISGDLNVTVGGESKEIRTNAEGKGALTLENLTANTYLVVANYMGSEYYHPSIATGSFNVAKMGTAFEFKEMTTKAFNYLIEGRVGEWFNFTLKDAGGKPLANKAVGIGNNGKIYNLTTDENGVASLQINLGKENWYTFAMSFIGDENYTAAFDIVKIVVETQTPKLTVPNKSYKASAKTKTLTATFKSSRGTALSKKRISFRVNGKTYTALTDKNGVAKVNVRISKKGSYKVTAKFAGDSTYSSIGKTATLKIK